MFSSQSSPARPAVNPFTQPVKNPFGPPSKYKFSQGSSGWQPPKENPFLKETPSLKDNPFLKKANPFEITKPPHNPFATNGANLKPAPQPFTDPKPAFPDTTGKSQAGPLSNGVSSTPASFAQDWGKQKQEFVQPAWQPSNDGKLSPSSKPAPNGEAVNGKRARDGGHRENSTSKNSGQQKPRANGPADDVATKIRDQLAKDGIKPPQWPSNPGSASQRKAVERFREAYSVYREKAMRSLIRAGLFDDPDKKRRLSEAINFKGICEEMCPDWDKVTRIVQHDVKKEEKEEINGELVASLPLMVTRYSRSSAGQDLPLPMDVRSPGALRRTLDYLISDLIPSDDLLPVRHHFLWDRTRAIRREFTFQGAAMSRDEKQDFLYCLETITRFHVTSLHLLSRPGFGHEGFSEQQEVEQLSKTLISLMEAYDDCARANIVCENEAEFRGYYIIFNAADPAIMQKVQNWGSKFWHLDGIRTAICLVQSLQNTWTETGSLIPRTETEMALSMAAMFFSIVASPQISYTMACFAEVHFSTARHAMLQIILNGYQRPKGGPKDITPAFLKEHLHFESDEDAIKFAELHHFKFRNDGGNMHMVLPRQSQQRRVPKVRVPHSYSHDIVERKRGSYSLPEVIYKTVWEEGHEEATGELQTAGSNEDSLFVDGPENATYDEDGYSEVESDIETVATTVSPPTRSEAEKATLTHSTSSLSTPATTGTQEVQSRDSAPQVNGAVATSSPFFKKPLEGISNQDGGVKKPEQSTAFSTTPTVEKTNEKTDAQSGTPFATTSSLFSFLNRKNNDPVAPSPPSQSQSISQIPATSSTSSAVPSTSVFPTPASAPSAGSLFPTSSGLPSSTSEPASATKVPITFGDASLKPKESTSNIGGLPLFTGQGSTASQKPTSSQPPAEQPQSLGPFKIAPIDKKPPLSQPQEPDPMDRFTRWYACGDRGLMETHLEESMLEYLLRDVWDEYLRSEEERKRREEDEKSWAEARQYRGYSLSVKYFYKWRDGSRRRRAIRRIQAERDKARQWRLPENVVKRESAARAAREKVVEEAKNLIHKKARENAKQTHKLNQSTRSNRQSQSSRQSREQSIENALLSSGVLDGVRYPQEAARYAARDVKTDSEEGMLPGEQMLLRVKNQRRRKQGLQPLKHMPEPKTYKEGTKSAMLKSLSSGTGRDSLSMSTGSFRHSTFSSSYRSSLGFNSSRISKMRSKVTDPYWRLKASGLVQMPNGEYLHESLAIPMLQEGKRFPGLGDYGLPKEQSKEPSISPSQSPPPGDTSLVRYSTSDHLQRSRISNSPSIGNIFSRRKRIRVDEDEEVDEGLTSVHGREASGDRKRAKNGGEHVNSSPNDTDFLASIDDLLKQVQDVNRASSQT